MLNNISKKLSNTHTTFKLLFWRVLKNHEFSYYSKNSFIICMFIVLGVSGIFLIVVDIFNGIWFYLFLLSFQNIISFQVWTRLYNGTSGLWNKFDINFSPNIWNTVKLIEMKYERIYYRIIPESKKDIFPNKDSLQIKFSSL